MYYVCIELQIDRVEMSSANSREIILSIFIRLLKIKVFLRIIENIFFYSLKLLTAVILIRTGRDIVLGPILSINVFMD